MSSGFYDRGVQKQQVKAVCDIAQLLTTLICLVVAILTRPLSKKTFQGGLHKQPFLGLFSAANCILVKISFRDKNCRIFCFGFAFFVSIFHNKYSICRFQFVIKTKSVYCRTMVNLQLSIYSALENFLQTVHVKWRKVRLT